MQTQIMLIDMSGSSRILVEEPRVYGTPRFSPDGTRLAYSVGGDETDSDIWIRDLQSGTSTKLTTDGARNGRPEWTVDGKRVLYVSTRSGRRELWWQPADLSGAPEQVLTSSSASRVNAGVFSPDGSTLVYWVDTTTQTPDIYYRKLGGGDTTSRPLATTNAAELAPKVSPDGKWIAYVSNQDGRLQVYVQPFPPTGARYQVTADGGMAPVWSHDSRRIFYVANARLHAATIRAEPGFAVVNREALNVEGVALTSPPHATYDISPDGRYLVMLQPAGPGQIVVVHDWKHELRRQTKGPRE
jgi:Tol biopolymer transport system component